MINWDATNKEDSELIRKCVIRAMDMALHNGNKLDLSMDIEAAHISSPLRLQDLLNADNFNFAHDIEGIQRHIDRNTGKMTRCFLPRYTV